MMDDPSGRPPAGGVARRRRERRLRAQLRHEQQTVRMVLATVTHHSFQVGTAHDGLRAQKTVTSTREVEERVPHAGLRAQKAPPPGRRPGVLQDPAPQGRVGQHSGIGYELVLALDVPVLQMVEQPVDASALAFLEEIEANKLEAEYMQLVHDGFHKSPALTERMREVMRRRHVLRQKGRGRKKKKRRKKRLPLSPRPQHGCRRLCDHQRQVPVVRSSVVTQRQVPTVHSFMLPVQFLDTVFDMPVVVLRQVLGLMVLKTVVRPQLLSIVGRRHHLRSAEADPHGPDCSADHRDSSVAVRSQVVDALAVEVVRFHRLYISVYSAMLGSTVDTSFCVSLWRFSRFST